MRPEWITYQGWRESVLVHDQGYLAGIKAWRRKLASLHPDRRKWVQAVRRSTDQRKLVPCACSSLKSKAAAQCHACWMRNRHAYYFLRAQEAFQKWLTKEQVWYDQRGLVPPGPARHRLIRTNNVRVLTGGINEDQGFSSGQATDGIGGESDPRTVTEASAGV